MINLIPPQYADHIHYGRRNTYLAKGAVWLIIASVGMTILVIGGRQYINQQANSLKANIANSNKQIHAEKLDSAQAQAEQISNNAKLLNTIFSQEIRFSDLIPAIGKIMPAGASLGGLSISTDQDALDLQVNSDNSAQANQVAVNLVDPKYNLFDSVDIVTINCNPKTEPHCSSTLRALFSKDSQTRFLYFSGQQEADE